MLALVLLGMAGCDPYTGFGCVAPEGHPAVSHARSLSAKQLQAVFSEVTKLSLKHAPESYETQIYKADIPKSLSFLKAELIRVYSSNGSYIVLANCFDERVELTLSPTNAPKSSITLHWAEPTNENPYATGSQVLWEIDNDG